MMKRKTCYCLVLFVLAAILTRCDFSCDSTPPQPPPPPNATSLPFTIEEFALQIVHGTSPKVAFNGQNYLVVWVRDARQYEPDAHYAMELRGARITPDGTILDPGGFLIESAAEFPSTSSISYWDYRFRKIDVACGDDECLVVWDIEQHNTTVPYKGAIYGARISPQGTVSAPFAIDDTGHPEIRNIVDHQYPTVFWDGWRFIVIYRERLDPRIGSTPPVDPCPKDGVYARTVGTQAVGSKTLLIDLGCLRKYPTYYTLDLKSAGGSGGINYLTYIGKDDNAGNCGVYGAWVLGGAGELPRAEGFQLIKGGSVPNCATDFFRPAVAHGHGHFLVVWEDLSENLPTDTLPDIYGAHIVNDPDVVPSNLGQVATTDHSSPYPSVAYDGRNFTVVYKQFVGCFSYVGACRVSRGGTIGPSTTLPGAGLVNNTDLAFGDMNGLVVMSNTRVVYEEIYDETTGETFTRIAGNYPEVLGMFIDKSW